jgi:hypothetical protein
MAAKTLSEALFTVVSPNDELASLGRIDTAAKSGISKGLCVAAPAGDSGAATGTAPLPFLDTAVLSFFVMG